MYVNTLVDTVCDTTVIYLQYFTIVSHESQFTLHIYRRFFDELNRYVSIRFDSDDLVKKNSVDKPITSRSFDLFACTFINKCVKYSSDAKYTAYWFAVTTAVTIKKFETRERKENGVFFVLVIFNRE